MTRIPAIFCLAIAATFSVKHARPESPAVPSQALHFENQFLSLEILPGWTIAPPGARAQNGWILTLTRGRYVLAIDSLFGHASPVPGGRFSEILNNQPSVQAVMGDVERPAGGFECSLTPLPKTRVSPAITLLDLYTDPAKAKGNRYGCHFPAKPAPVWFASFFGGVGPETDYSIALTYHSADIDALPRKDSPELAEIFDQVAQMLRTLHLKPPVVITKIVPISGPPGTTVTVYGKGFTLPRQRASAIFGELPNSAELGTHVAPDGESLTFVVPASVTRVSCPAGKVEVNENCAAIPPGDIDVYYCPNQGSSNCSTPITPATYHVFAEDSPGLRSNGVQFTVTAPPATSVSLRLLYPAYYVRAGDVVTLRGSGFTSTGNTVHIGSMLVPNQGSAGDSIRFAVPNIPHSSFQSFKVSVSNSNGASNVLTLAYR